MCPYGSGYLMSRQSSQRRGIRSPSRVTTSGATLRFKLPGSSRGQPVAASMACSLCGLSRRISDSPGGPVRGAPELRKNTRPQKRIAFSILAHPRARFKEPGSLCMSRAGGRPLDASGASSPNPAPPRHGFRHAEQPVVSFRCPVSTVSRVALQAAATLRPA